LSSPAVEYLDTAATRVVLAELLAERRNQIERHRWTPEHDDAHGPDEFAWLIARRAVEMCTPAALAAVDARRLLVEMAAIATAAIESFDRRWPKDEDL
jgi:hypothetical protein